MTATEALYLLVECIPTPSGCGCLEASNQFFCGEHDEEVEISGVLARWRKGVFIPSFDCDQGVSLVTVIPYHDGEEDFGDGSLHDIMGALRQKAQKISKVPVKILSKEHWEWRTKAWDSLEKKYKNHAKENVSKDIERAISSKVVVIDLETTDFHGYPIEIAITDMCGEEIFQSLIHTTFPVDPGAQKVHGISKADLVDAPHMGDIIKTITPLIGTAHIATYNASFDWETIVRGCDATHTSLPKWTAPDRWHCIMRARSILLDSGARWQKLHGNHRALGDAQAAAAVLRDIAVTVQDVV